MDRFAVIVALLVWVVITLAHWFPAYVGTKLGERLRLLAWIGVVSHGVGLAWASYLSVVTTGFPEAVSAVALSLGIAYAYVAEGKQRSIGLLLAPTVLVLLAGAQIVPHHQVAALSGAKVSPWLPIHLGLMTAGVTGFALSSLVGTIYLWVRRRLKAKKFQGLSRLPSLEALDRIQFRSLLFGFIFLTLGIGAGGAWAAAMGEEAWVVSPKVLYTLAVWAWYAVALQIRLVAGRRGRWTALFNIVGFAGMIFSLVGVNFLIGGFHSYGG